MPNPEAQHDQIGLQHIPNGHFVKLVYSRGKAYEVIREDLYLAMSRLPQNELETIILLYWEGLWQTEVAAFLGISPRTVYARKERAIEKLRQWMRMPEENDDTTENDTG